MREPCISELILSRETLPESLFHLLPLPPLPLPFPLPLSDRSQCSGRSTNAFELAYSLAISLAEHLRTENLVWISLPSQGNAYCCDSSGKESTVILLKMPPGSEDAAAGRRDEGEIEKLGRPEPPQAGPSAPEGLGDGHCRYSELASESFSEPADVLGSGAPLLFSCPVKNQNSPLCPAVFHHRRLDCPCPAGKQAPCCLESS